MHIPKVPLQPVLAVDAVGACRMEQAIHHPRANVVRARSRLLQ
jgi:hypothetical protein